MGLRERICLCWGWEVRLGALQKRLYEVDGTWPELWDKIQTERQGIRTDVGK